MTEKLEIETQDLTITGRTKIYLDNKNITGKVQQIVIVMSKAEPTKAFVVFEPKKIHFKAPVVREDNLVDRILSNIKETVKSTLAIKTDVEVDKPAQ